MDPLESTRAPSAVAPRLRDLLLRSSILITALALLVLAIPLALYINSTNMAEAVAALEREATRVVALSPDDVSHLPAPMDPDVSIGLYGSDGGRIAGQGPIQDADARGALAEGTTRVKDEDGDLAVYVPFDQPGGQQTTVRAVIAESIPRNRTYVTWLLLLVGCVLALTLSGLVAVRRSRQLAQPFERIAAAARQMRSGDLVMRIGPTGVREGDETGWLLEEASRETAHRMHREIEVAQDANHQVRTPVAAARVTLEAAMAEPGADLRAAATQAIAHLERAGSAIEEVLALRRDGLRDSPAAPAGPIMDGVRSRWAPLLRGGGRELQVVDDAEARAVVVSEIALRESLEILVSNALLHGTGTVSILSRELAGSLAVDVVDEGTIAQEFSVDALFVRGATTRNDASSGGLGLSLARSLAEQAGGRLLLAARTPTTFTLVLPGVDHA